MDIKLFFLIAVTILLGNSCKNDKTGNLNCEKTDSIKKNNFVYIKDKSFQLNDSTFFPILINYSTCLRILDEEIVVSPIKGYGLPRQFSGNSKDSIVETVEGHLQLIKEMGFNTIRLVGPAHVKYDKNGALQYTLHKNSGITKVFVEEYYSKVTQSIEDFISIAQSKNLRVMMLLPRPRYKRIENENRRDYITKILTHFSNNPTIFAYDFFNEPLYFDRKDAPKKQRPRSKESAYDLVCQWKNIVRKNAPNQLFTVGFSEPTEVFEWDPSILPVDFIAFHSYHPLRVPNEIFWYANYSNKPWMLAETSLPADNDSISYQEQKLFMLDAYRRTVSCGGAGFGWWAFQEIPHGTYEHKYTSLLNHEGTTRTKDGQHKILGSPKPAAKTVTALHNVQAEHNCKCWTNYYNILGYHNYVINGKVIDEDTDEPVEGAVVRGWSKWWKIGANTFTDEHGNFKLYSNKPFKHFEISAPGMSKVKFNKDIEYTKINPESKISKDSLENFNLEYHDISYQWFLKDKSILDTGFVDTARQDYYTFNFDPTLFNNAVYKAKMDPVELSELSF